MEEEILFCRQFSTTTGDNIFKMADSFFNERLKWNQCFSVCTDGAMAMPGAHQGFCARMKEINHQVKIFHCFLYRENLASKYMSPDLEM
jgi:hypothetical protein